MDLLTHNRNVTAICVINFFVFFHASMFYSVVFDVFLLSLTGSNTGVGLAESVSGLTGLICALPVGLVVDSRYRLLMPKVAGFLGFFYTAVMGLAIHMESIHLLYLALFTFGLFFEVLSSSTEAIFSDSVPHGSRSAVFSQKRVVELMGTASGPAVSFFLFWYFGNQWTPFGVILNLYVALLVAPLGCFLAFGLVDPKTLRTAEEQEGVVAPEEARPMDGRRWMCLTEKSVPYLVITSLLITMCGAGMTIRFFNLFFYNDLGFSPDQNMALTVVSTLTLSLFTVRLQKLSVYFGRAQMVWVSLVLNSMLTALISTNKNHVFIVGMFIIRGAVAMSSWPINRSILMDYVPSETRGRWNAVASMASTFWSGSALIGGWLSDKHGYRFTFLITAGVYVISSSIYAPLMILVNREKLDTPSEQSSPELEMEGGEPLITG